MFCKPMGGLEGNSALNSYIKVCGGIVEPPTPTPLLTPTPVPTPTTVQSSSLIFISPIK